MFVCLRLLSVVLLAGMAQATPVSVWAAENDRADAGLKLAQQYCANCHAVEDETESPHKDAPPFRVFASKWPLENIEEALAEGIVTGHPDMPAFVFEPHEIDAFIEHLHRLALKHWQ